MKMKFKMITALILAAVLFAGTAVVPNRSVGTVASAASVSDIQQLRYDLSILESHIGSRGYLSYYRSSNTASAVKALQRSLNTLEGESLSVDGGFGSATRQAVKNFQAKYGLVVDALFGTDSVRKLRELVDSYEKRSNDFNNKELIISSYLNSNLVLDNENSRNVNENNIGLYYSHGGPNQIWVAELAYVDASGKNWYKLYPKSSSDGRFALNVNHGGNFNNLQMYEYSRSGNELFGFEPMDNSAYYISSFCGGYITCDGNFDGSNVYRREGNKTNSDNQKWFVSEVGSQSAQTQTSINLNVEKISQIGEYWSNYRYSNSGSTVANRGCTLCSFTMLYNYRSGMTSAQNNPLQMAKKLSFDSNGDLYWSSVDRYGFTSHTYSNYYYNTTVLKDIYSQLKNGKPVMIGATGTSQHWLVVSGFSGDPDNIKASDFKVLDPANRDSTLAKYLANRPYIYRIVY